MQTGKVRGIIFDWGRTLFDNESGNFFPETLKTVKFFHSVCPLAIVSIVGEKKEGEKGLSSISERRQALSQTGLGQYFDLVLFTENPEGKPDLFLQVKKFWDLQPEEILIVDDRMKHLAWAIENGFQTVWLMKGKFAEEFPNKETGNPDVTLTALSDLQLLFWGRRRRT